MRYFIIIIYTLFSVSAFAGDVTKGTITWTVSGEDSSGQFVTGDYYVVCPSGCSVTEISPAWNGDDNGAQLNPVPNITQGLHAATGGLSAYSAILNVADDLPGTPIALVAGDILVSSTGRTGETEPWPTRRSVIAEAAILTVVASAPASGSFRPGYCSDGTVEYNVSDLDYSHLGTLAGTASEYNMATVADLFARPRVEFYVGSNTRYFRPANNMEDYGEYVTEEIEDAALMLQTDASNATKEDLMIGFVQNGIDLYSITETLGPWGSVMGPFAANGGHWGGRKFPILFAGMVLDDSGMLAIGDKSGDYVLEGTFGSPPADYIYFAEDDQTFYLTQDEINCTTGVTCTWDPDSARGDQVYSSAMIDMPEWGIRHVYIPDKDNADWSAAYRESDTAIVWPGWLLAAYIMDMKTLWNHDVLFDYQDRYMAITNGDDDPFGYTVNHELEDLNARGSNFSQEMWDEYRDDYPLASGGSMQSGTGTGSFQ